MIKTKKIFFGIAITLSSLAFAQTKKKLLESIEEQKAEIEEFLRFSGMRITLEPGKAVQFDPKDIFNFRENYRKNQNPERFQEFFDKLGIRYLGFYPYNIITLRFYDGNLAKFFGGDGFYYDRKPQEYQPKIVPVSITYLDGSVEDVGEQYIDMQKIEAKIGDTDDEENIEKYLKNQDVLEKYIMENRSSFHRQYGFYQTKPIHKIKFRIDLPIEQNEYYELGKNQTELTINGHKIREIQWQANELRYIIPKELEDKVNAIAYYDEDKMLEQRSGNSHSVLEEKHINAYKKIYELLDKAKKMVEDNVLTNEEDIEEYVKKEGAEYIKTIEEQPKEQAVSRKFSGNIDRVELEFLTGKLEQKTLFSTYEIRYKEREKDYTIAVDTRKEEKNYGIIGRDGKWLIEPQFSDNFSIHNRFFFSDKAGVDEDGFYILNYYRFDPKNNTITPVEYDLHISDLYENKYAQVEDKKTKLKGIINAETGQIMIPMLYRSIDFLENKVWIVEVSEHKEGFYDKDFKLVIPPTTDYIKYIDGVLEVKTNNIYDLYDLEGNRLTHLGYHHYIDNDERNYFLVKKYTKMQENIALEEEYYLLDKQGKILLNLPYHKVRRARFISKNLIAAEDTKTNKYGYLNFQGEWVIPPKFDDIHTEFLEKSNYAMVSIDRNEYLIDMKGNIIKKMPVSIVSYRSEPNKYGRYFMDIDGNEYDNYGELIITPKNSNESD